MPSFTLGCRRQEGKYVVRVDERGGKAGAGKWEASMAVAAYYGPRAGGVRFAPGINGYCKSFIVVVVIIAAAVVVVVVSDR
jgi:hypothetical protein